VISLQNKLKFKQDGYVHFDVVKPGVIAAKLNFNNSSASIALLGSTVISYLPSGFSETLFLSKINNFLPGKAIRGGIPLCWPWFGANPHNISLPPHGFFRLLEWEVVEAIHNSVESTITLSLSDSEESKHFWPYGFNAKCHISIGEKLEITINITNSSKESWMFSGAFHPYLNFADIRNVGIHSFVGQYYLDNTVLKSEDNHRVQKASLKFAEEVNRVYAYSGPVKIDDLIEQRQITISNESMESTGVWTPWKAKCAASSDLGEDVFTQFLCVEPGIIPPQSKNMKPNNTYEAKITISVSTLCD
jgi:D-hexose-6-phosphate mutarotase